MMKILDRIREAKANFIVKYYHTEPRSVLIPRKFSQELAEEVLIYMYGRYGILRDDPLDKIMDMSVVIRETFGGEELNDIIVVGNKRCPKCKDIIVECGEGHHNWKECKCR